MAASKPLVIVESPAKAKTLGRFLGDKYRVEASYGHIRDLPESAADVPKEIKEKDWGRLGVDVEQDFTPYYVVPSDKRKQVAHLKTAVKDASELLLATDPDREGESISWHLTQVLKPKVPVRRIVFHEITEDAVKEALDNPGDVNENLVRAQESRRILDRLYGYTLSPVLWKKVQTGLSAGRVQSVAVRLIVEREEERRAFRSAEYWDVEAPMKGEGREFIATLVRINDQRIATGKDFDAQTGALKNQSARLLDGPTTQRLVEAVRTNVPWTVTNVEQKPGVERPAPPFTTSTLTQEASRKLGFSTERTMQVAQRLFQGVDVGNGQMEGLITYHRTDSTTLSDKAINESARVIREMFGGDYYDAPRRYQTRVKNAQEAHEAIRPTDFRLAPSQLEGALDPDEVRVYELIWKRTMASQMVDARVLRTTLEISAKGPDGETAAFTASGKAIEFAGFRRAYVEGSDDPAAELEEQEAILPRCSVGDRIHSNGSTPITLVGAEPKRHETVPPARFTEASLIKELERLGIGRPSTYAPTIATIVRRGYVFRQAKALVPSFTAFAVTKLLREHFGDFVESDFTAEMEDDLDEISRGERESIAFLKQFYYGDTQASRSVAGSGTRRREGGLPDARPWHRSREWGKHSHSHWALRAVRAGCRGRARSNGVAAGGCGSGRSDGRQSARAGSRQGRRSANARRRFGDGPERLRDERAIWRVRSTGRDSRSQGQGTQGREAEARIAPGRHDRFHCDAGRGAQAALLAARRRPAPGRQRTDHDQLRSLRSVREAWRRIPIARVGRRRVQHLLRCGARAAARPEAVASPACGTEEGPARAD